MPVMTTVSSLAAGAEPPLCWAKDALAESINRHAAATGLARQAGARARPPLPAVRSLWLNDMAASPGNFVEALFMIALSESAFKAKL
jgi:hypothetical protein